METFRGIKIRDIFLDNQNWLLFFNVNCALIRDSIIINVCKLLACKTSVLGFHKFSCPKCNQIKKVFHTCKSRFCSSCGKKATEQWIKRSLGRLPNVPFQHSTFTLPQELRSFFWVNRYLMNRIVPIPASIITKLASYKRLIPGIFTVIHTFGRDMKTNVHFHVSSTSGGLSLNYQKWIPDFFIKHDTVKRMWKSEVLKVLRILYKQGKLQMPPELRHLDTYTKFNQWLDILYQKSWVVHLQKKSDNHKHNVKYVGRYLKRPPIAETRITQYDAKNVTFYYLSHYTKQKTFITLTVSDFIARLIKHIPDANFRLIRYYNWLSNRTCSQLLPIVYKLVKHQATYSSHVTWRELYKSSFGIDPLICAICKVTMTLQSIYTSSHISLLIQHESLATNH